MSKTVLELTNELIEKLEEERKVTAGAQQGKLFNLQKTLQAFLRSMGVKQESRFATTDNPLSHKVKVKVQAAHVVKRVSLKEAAEKYKAIQAGTEDAEIEYITEEESEEEETEGNVLATTEDKPKRTTRRKK